MKLSLKFFCLAYIIVLFSSGFCAIRIITLTSNEMWESRIERVNTAQIYAADSFISFSEISSRQLFKKELQNTAAKIKSVLDDCVTGLKIIEAENAAPDYKDLKNGEGFYRFVHENGVLTMESVLCVSTGLSSYHIIVLSDFSEIESYCTHLWNEYRIMILVLSAVSGLLILVMTYRITKPINLLSKTASSIASGNFGETVNISFSNSAELKELSDNFNTMSLKVKDEIERRDTFVADFTHELKTPMTSIIGFSQMLEAYELSEEEKKSAARAISKEAKRLEKLSHELLNLYIYKNEKIKLESTSLSEIETELSEALKPVSEKYHIPFTVSFHNVSVLANKSLLISLLSNLAENAFKACFENSRVDIFSVEKKAYVYLVVKDTGIGISEENLKHIEDPFFRVDKARSRKLGGAGLGLSICKELASLHGSSLRFKSELNKGTVVSFRLKKEADTDE